MAVVIGPVHITPTIATRLSPQYAAQMPLLITSAIRKTAKRDRRGHHRRGHLELLRRDRSFTASSKEYDERKKRRGDDHAEADQDPVR